MELKLYHSSLQKKFRDIEFWQVRSRHLNLRAKMALLLTGRATYLDGQSYEAVYSPLLRPLWKLSCILRGQSHLLKPSSVN